MLAEQHDDAERAFVASALATIYAGNFEDLRDMFATTPDADAVRIGKLVSDRLFAHAARTGDFATWAEALHHLPRPGQREAAAEFCARLDAWRKPAPARPADDGARRLRGLACQLVRAGTPGRELLRRLDDANATLAAPMSAEQIENVAVWAAKVAKEQSRAA